MDLAGQEDQLVHTRSTLESDRTPRQWGNRPSDTSGCGGDVAKAKTNGSARME